MAFSISCFVISCFVIMRLKLPFKAVSMLFDSLIKPIVLYGSPIWTPTNSIVKYITKNFNSVSSQN